MCWWLGYPAFISRTGLFALGEKPTTEQLLDWLPDRWLLNRTRDHPIRELTAG